MDERVPIFVKKNNKKNHIHTPCALYNVNKRNPDQKKQEIKRTKRKQK